MRGCAALVGVLVLCGEVCGQEALNTVAATQPGEGSVVYQTRLRALRFEDDASGRDREGTDLRFEHRVQYGLSGRDSLRLDWAYVWRSFSSGEGVEDVDGAGDLRLSYKRRVWEEDLGPVDTVRFAVFGGLELPTGGGGVSSDSVDPFAGLAATTILGRHGFGQSVSWTFTTGSTDERLAAGDALADVFRSDSAYLYRLWPSEFGSAYRGAWYAVLELNVEVETDGSSEGLLSPGLLYEGTTWAAEVGVQLPVWSDVVDRPERAWGLSAGLRFLF